jgi:osmotically-inducible protein OsmY
MAERKLRIDAAESVAIRQPRIIVSAVNDQSASTGAGLAPPTGEASAIEESLDDSLSPLERAIRQKLISDPGVSISSLVVRQIDGGVCLEGIIETHGELTDVERLVRSVTSVDRVLNRLVARPPDASG